VHVDEGDGNYVITNVTVLIDRSDVSWAFYETQAD
jgi:hypothetical protein